MRVVLDATIVAAALIRPGGWTARQLRRPDAQWVVPVFIVGELEAHEAEFAGKAQCDVAQWRHRTRQFIDRVTVMEAPALLAVRNHELVRRAEKVDPDDAVYLAALVAADADLLWTRDRAVLEAFPGLAVTVVPGAPSD